MPRFKDIDWNLPIDAAGNIQSWDCVKTAVLMDIRDELKEIGQSLRPLRCHNFLTIPRTLNKIARNTTKARKKKTQDNPPTKHDPHRKKRNRL